jgi:hypothetical protein
MEYSKRRYMLNNPSGNMKLEKGHKMLRLKRTL